MICKIAELLENGSVIPQIDSEYNLIDSIDAVHKLEDGHAKGKIIIKCI